MRNLGLKQSTDEKKRQSEDDPELQDAFSTITLVGDEDDDKAISNPITQTWLGHFSFEGHEEEYQRCRNDLADAAKYGRWDDVFRLIDLGRSVYGESWANALRMSES